MVAHPSRIAFVVQIASGNVLGTSERLVAGSRIRPMMASPRT